jgi:replicative DNA helicase
MKLELIDPMLEADLTSFLIENPHYTIDAKKILTPDVFTSPLNKAVYSACVELSDVQNVFSRTDVFRLVKSKKLQGINEADILSLRPKRIIDLSDVCIELKELYAKRALANMSANIHSMLLSGTDVNTIRATIDAESEAMNLGVDVNSEVVSISDVFDTTITLLEENAGKAKFSGVDTGSRQLNYSIGGFQAGMIVIAARPSAGKTIVGLDFAKKAGMSGKNVLLLSLEMPKESLMNRFISSEASEFTYADLGAYRLSQEDINKIKDSDATNLKRLPIYFYDSDNRDINYLSSIVISECRKHKIDIVIIDYLQLIRDNQIKDQSDFAQVSSVSTKIQRLTRKLNIPIVCLSQLSRTVEGRNDKRPQLSDIRSSGNIEQDASIVIGLYRPHYYALTEARANGTPEPTEIDTTLEFVILKNRNGMTGSIVRHCDVLTNRVSDTKEELFRFVQPEVIYQDSKINSIQHQFDDTNISPF